jgi:hypothetical protein
MRIRDELVSPNASVTNSPTSDSERTHPSSPARAQKPSFNSRYFHLMEVSGILCGEKIASINWNAAAQDVERFLNTAEKQSLKLWNERFFRTKMEQLAI